MAVVSVEDIKAHLNITFDADDSLIGVKIDAAQAHVEAQVGQAFDDMDTAPPDLVEAVRQLAAHWYENREAVLVGISAQDMPLSVRDILREHRIWSF